MSQLRNLAKPFDDYLVHKNPSGGGDYAMHSTVNEKLLAVIGPFDFEVVQLVRGFVDAKAPNPKGESQKARDGSPALTDAVVGVICRLTCQIDGRTVRVEEVGDCESPHNWDTDGKRLKDAMSDSLKRCAMRVGVGLHMWSQHKGNDLFFLYEYLRKRESRPVATAGAAPAEPVKDDSRPFTEDE